MFNTNEGYSLSDIAAVTRGENDGFGFGGASGWWIILLFLFAFGGWGNGGFGWGGGNGAANVTADIGYNFDMHDISDEVRDLQASTSNGFRDLSTGMTNGFYNLNTGLLTGFSGVQSQICNSEFNTLQAINGNTMSGMQNTNALQSQLLIVMLFKLKLPQIELVPIYSLVKLKILLLLAQLLLIIISQLKLAQIEQLLQLV